MALSVTQSLTQARNAVLARCSCATSGNQSANLHPLVTELLRSAQNQLYPEAEWLSLRKTVSITLTADVQVYDWPDDAAPGKLYNVAVLNTTGTEYQCDFGLRPVERASSKSNGVLVSGRPLLVTFVNSNLTLYPAPSDEYASLLVDYLALPTDLVNDGDPLDLDSELVIQHAVLALKRHLYGDVPNVEVQNFERYLTRARAEQSLGDGFQLGGHQSFRNAVQKRNRVADSRRRFGNNAPYDTGWNPW